MNVPHWPVLRPFQTQAIQCLRRSPHVVLCAPTGAGKSLVFQRYLHEESSRVRAVLVTPLVALGRQQLQRFQSLGIKAWCGVGDASRVQYPDQGCGVWVVSPERLLHREVQVFEAWKPNFFIFDEAHCVFEWGSAFRPAFGKLAELFQRKRVQKSFWCSATLRPEMMESIRSICGPQTEILGEFKLPENIELTRLQKHGAEKLEWLELWLRHHPTESGIIYVGTRVLADRLSKYLSALGKSVWVYHAGMSAEERKTLESQIDQAHAKGFPFLVVATSAFGMGMDYPRLRFGVVFDPPYSLLQLAQSLGRVGRSGDPAQVYLLWNKGDFQKLRFLSRRRQEPELAIDRLEHWYVSQEHPRQAMEKDFREPFVSGKIEMREYSE